MARVQRLETTTGPQAKSSAALRNAYDRKLRQTHERRKILNRSRSVPNTKLKKIPTKVGTPAVGTRTTEVKPYVEGDASPLRPTRTTEVMPYVEGGPSSLRPTHSTPLQQHSETATELPSYFDMQDEPFGHFLWESFKLLFKIDRYQAINHALVLIIANIILLFLPRFFSIIYSACRLFFGYIYPAYGSYKAVRGKNGREYVKWMMFWIVFAIFVICETFTDIFLSWFPFYYEIKVCIVFWILSPATKGSSILYRKFVHPALQKREHEIDEYLHQFKERGYSAFKDIGSRGVNMATNYIVQTALKTVQSVQLPTSQSDPAIYQSSTAATTIGARAIRNSPQDDEIDALIDEHARTYFMRSQSLNVINGRQIMEFSEDEELAEIATAMTKNTDPDYIPNDDDDMLVDEPEGVARTRAAPKRKTKVRKTKTTTTNTAGAGDAEADTETQNPTRIRGRRRLREPSMDGGGNLVQTIRRSYSLTDLSEPDLQRTQDEIDEVSSLLRPMHQRMLRQRMPTPLGRSASSSGATGGRHSTGMYFTELDVAGKRSSGDIHYNIRSSEDISSGYSSIEQINPSSVMTLSRTSSMTSASRTRVKSKRAEDKLMSASCTTLPRSRRAEKTAMHSGPAKPRNKSEK